MKDQDRTNFRITPGGIFQCKNDPGWTVIYANDGLFQFLEYTREEFRELFDNQLACVIYPEDLEPLCRTASEQLKRGNVVENENRLVCKSGEVKWIWISCEFVTREGEEPYFYCMFHDITRQKQAQSRMEISERRYDLILSMTQDVIYEWNYETREIFYAPTFEKKFGYVPPADNFPYKVLEMGIIYPDDEELFRSHFRKIEDGFPEAVGEYRIRKADESFIWCRITASAIRDENEKLQKVIGMISDIDEQKRKVFFAQEQAMRDTLTGLYNRGATESLINDYLNDYDGLAAFLVIDVDNFKGVNDTLGHVYGDAVLGDMGYHLKKMSRSGDIIGRVGGDEFVVFLTKIPDEETALHVARRIGRIFHRSIGEAHIQYEITGSIGIAFYPKDGQDYLSLFSRADTAMYYAKHSGKNQLSVYNEQKALELPIHRKEEPDEERPGIQKNFRDNIIEYVFRIFYENEDVDKGLPVLLDLIGKIFDESRLYILETTDGPGMARNTFEWCNTGIPSMKDEQDVFEYVQRPMEFDQNQIYSCEDVEILPEGEFKDWLVRRGVVSTLICRLIENHRVVAVIGFEDCRKKRRASLEEKDALSLISQTISLFLMRARRQEEIRRQQTFSERLLKRVTTCIYSIDPETYKLDFVNSNMRCAMKGLKVGELCYRSIRGMERPCQDCPMAELRQDQQFVTKELYHPNVKKWTETTASYIQWADGRKVCLVNSYDITRYKEKKESERNSDMRYMAVPQQIKLSVWEYDLQKDVLVLAKSTRGKNDSQRCLERIPESLIDMGLVHPESVETVRKLYAELKDGKRAVQQEIRARADGDSQWQWVRIRYLTIFDEVGRPVRAIGVGENITQIKEAEIKYQEELRAMHILSDGVVWVSQVNLTENRVEDLKSEQYPDYICQGDMTYEEMLQMVSEEIVNPDDRKRFLGSMSRGALRTSYASGHTTVSMDYRFKNSKGRMYWVNYHVKLVPDAITRDLYAYGMVRDIDAQKNMELSLNKKAQKDPDTGVYNKETAMSMMKEAIRKGAEDQERQQLLVFRLDTYEELAGRGGYLMADDVMKELSGQLKLVFGAPQVMGRFGMDELDILLAGDKPEREIMDMVREVRKTIKTPYLFAKIPIDAVVTTGIAYTYGAYTDLQNLYLRARIALEAAEKEDSRCLIYSEKLSEKNWKLKPAKDWEDSRVTFYENKDMQEVLLRCAFSLMTSKDFERAIDSVLRQLAGYYGADCAFLVEFESGAEEWKQFYMFPSDRKRTRKKQLPPDRAGTWHKWFISNNKLACENIEELKENFPDEYRRLKENGVHSIQAVVLQADNEITGCLGIENPGKNRMDFDLLDSVKHFVINEMVKRNMQQDQEYLGYHDVLTNLLNRNSYIQYSTSLKEDTLISLGVLSADINGLKKVNIAYGHDAGDRLVKQTADILKNQFYDSQVFRFAGDEFMVVSENLTREVFRERIELVRMKVAESYAMGVSIGYAWADTEIRLDRLVAHADERMVIAKQNFYKREERESGRYNPHRMEGLKKVIQQGLFKMYLQPKAEISSGRVSGAEALVRFEDERLGIIGPDKFIPQLEREGMIYAVDLYMFGRVCETLKSWMDQGRPLLMISVNFSRSTLLEENLTEQVEEIWEKYQVPKEYIEIEITESFGEMERETLVQIGQRIIEHGFRLSLDDFGAQYSNIAILSVLPLHELKLDKSLIHGLFSSDNTRIVVKHFLNLCKELGIQSVAEGVESAEQLDILRELGCGYIQGYYLNKPVPLAEFEQMYMVNLLENYGHIGYTEK